jgi:UDP-2,3-diacylglucosamine hydrolase
MQPTLFISDLHLAPVRPELEQVFHRFCRGPARAAAALYVLGDLFDAWAGDEQVGEPLAARVAASLTAVAACTPVISTVAPGRAAPVLSTTATSIRPV